MNERTIFLEALEKDNPEQRSAFLDEVCGEDSELRQRVETLLGAHNDAGSFLEKTPQEIDADSVFAQTVEKATGQGEGSISDDAWQNLLTPSDDSGRLGNLGPYEICELVGRGGMGVVLRAHEPKLSRTVAVKLLAPELALNPIAVQRFLREARAAAAVSHDHVVAIHSIDDESHPPVIVMEFIQGQSLQQKIDKVGALDVRSILRIGMQTAAGLSAAHRQGLVHRDIKPANILLENGIERVKLTDFGLARAVDDISMTRTGQITGTPQYMSPEQAQGQRVDHRTDLFSLGCVLYAMCTGRAAFRADSAVAVMHRVVHDSPRPIREVNEDIPEWLCEIVEKLLAKEADDRFDSAEKVEDLLSRHLAHLQQPTAIPQPATVELPGTSVQGDTVVSSQTPLAVETAIRQGNVPNWLLWKIPAWSPLILICLLAGLRVIIKFGPPQYAEVAETANILVILVAIPIAVAMIIRKLSNDRRAKTTGRSEPESHSGFWLVLFAAVPVVAGLSMKSLAGDGLTGGIGAMVITMLAVLFLLKKRRDMGQEPPAPNATSSQSAGVSSESDPAVPQWLLRPFPVWLLTFVFSALCGIQLLNDYGPELPLRLELLPAIYIFQFAVAPLLIVAMFLSKWLRARAGVVAEQDDESRERSGVLAVSLAVAIVVTFLTCDAMGIEKRTGPLLIGTTIGAAIGLVVASRRARRNKQATETASGISDDLEVGASDRDRLSRFVEISEELERDLQGVGSTLMFVGLAAMMAPLGTYLISDQVDIPCVEIILGFFLLTSLLIFPITMRASLDLNWLPITRRRPGAAMLVATSLAIVPWNPLLLIMLPWTLRAMRRVRQPDVLQLIGVSEDDPRVRSAWGTGLGLLRKPAFVFVALVFVIFAFCEGSGSTHIGIRVKGIVQGTGTISFEGLKPGGSVLGPGNAATTADALSGHYEATLPAGSYEIVSVTDRSFVKRMPLTVDAGNCGSVIVEMDAQGLIIRDGSRTRRSDGVISVTTSGEVICEGGEIYHTVTGCWVVFVPPGKYRITTVLKDGSFSKTTSDVKPSPFLDVLRKADNVSEVRIDRILQSSPVDTSDASLRSPFFEAFTKFVIAPEKRSDVFKLMLPYHAGKPVTKRVTDDSGRSYLEWEVKSTIEGTSNSLRNNLPVFRDHVSEIAKENGARVTKTTPTDGEHRAVAIMVIEYSTAATKGAIRMEMTGFQDRDLHGHQMLNCGLRFEIQEWAE